MSKRWFTRKPHLDAVSGADVYARQAGRQRCGIVRNHQVAGTQKLRQLRAWRVTDRALLVDI
jgi:hypothetical protein